MPPRAAPLTALPSRRLTAPAPHAHFRQRQLGATSPAVFAVRPCTQVQWSGSVGTEKRGEVYTQVQASGRVDAKTGVFEHTGPVKWQGVHRGKGNSVYGVVETEGELVSGRCG